MRTVHIIFQVNVGSRTLDITVTALGISNSYVLT